MFLTLEAKYLPTLGALRIASNIDDGTFAYFHVAPLLRDSEHRS